MPERGPLRYWEDVREGEELPSHGVHITPTEVVIHIGATQNYARVHLLMVSGLTPKCRAVSRTFPPCSRRHWTTFHQRAAPALGPAGSRARRAAPGSMAPYTLIVTPAYCPSVLMASVRYVSAPTHPAYWVPDPWVGKAGQIGRALIQEVRGMMGRRRSKLGIEHAGGLKEEGVSLRGGGLLVELCWRARVDVAALVFKASLTPL